MSVATLTVRPLEGRAHETRQVQLVCPHGRTDAYYANAVDGFELDDQTVIRHALLRHHQEQACRCTRKLWARAFRSPWPTVPYTPAGAGAN